MKKTVRIGNHVFAMEDHMLRDLEAKAIGKRQPKLKRAADRAWERLAKTVADFQPKKGKDGGA